MILNITNGDYFNDYFLSRLGGEALPFREAMMDGDTVSDVYSEAFVKLRSGELGVSVDEYKSKMLPLQAFTENKYRELRLWFGKDTFCQANLLTLLAYLEQIGYSGQITLNYIDDETFQVVEGNVPVRLGIYKKLYEDTLIAKKHPIDTGVLDAEAIELYFDYHSHNGSLAQLVLQNPDKDDMSLILLLLESSKKYGLSDIQAERIVKRLRGE